MSERKRSIPAFVGVACVWLGTHFGPGFASGTMLNNYYTKFGFIGVFMPVIAMAILGFALYYAIEYSRMYKVHNFNTYARSLYSPIDKIMWPLFDISYLYTVISVLGAALAAIGKLLENFWGIPYWIGVISVIIIGVLLCIFGAELVRKSSSYMMFFVIGVLLIVIILAFTIGDADLAGSIANSSTNAKDPTIWGAIWSAIVYASFQSTIVCNVCSVTETLGTRKESKKAAWFGYIGNIVITVPTVLLLFSFTNVFGVTDEALPLYSILQRLNMPWLTTVYILLVLLAVVTSIVGFIFSGIARYKKFIKIKNEQVRDGLIAGVILLACAFAASFGLVALVSTGFTILGYINMPIIILPALIVARHKISKKYAQKKGMQIVE